MARWADVEREAPELAERVKQAFDANKHKTMATLRLDGAPRISGTELDFFDGNAYLGSMPGSVKARDLQRDPRIALHSATVDPELAGGDAKLAGRAIEVTDRAEFEAFLRRYADENEQAPEGDFPLFRIDVEEIVLTAIGDPPDHLVIESWHEGKGTRRVERK
jgi:hypothetical protein